MSDLTIHQLYEAYDGKRALLAWWEEQPKEVQFANKEYITALKVKIRSFRARITTKSCVDDRKSIYDVRAERTTETNI